MLGFFLFFLTPHCSLSETDRLTDAALLLNMQLIQNDLESATDVFIGVLPAMLNMSEQTYLKLVSIGPEMTDHFTSLRKYDFKDSIKEICFAKQISILHLLNV